MPAAKRSASSCQSGCPDLSDPSQRKLEEAGAPKLSYQREGRGDVPDPPDPRLLRSGVPRGSALASAQPYSDFSMHL
ncbi:hypothetical protein FOZ63_007467, partial [Perkinsus olseni]